MKKRRACPACKFENAEDAARCLMCRAFFPVADDTAAQEKELENETEEGVRWVRFKASEMVSTTRHPRPADEERVTSRLQRSSVPPTEPPTKARPQPPAERARPAAEKPSAPPAEKAPPAAEKAATGPGPALGKTALPRPSARLSAFEVDGPQKEKVLAWLGCEPLPPMPLGITPRVVIGRAPGCDLVLPHNEVSRIHSVIKVLGRDLVISDEGSSNGTFLNGRRVSSQLRFRVGDSLTIGPYQLEVRASRDTPAGSQTPGGDTTAVEKAIEGSLDETPLAEVLQGLEFNQKSGTLIVLSGPHRGHVVVRDGKPLRAEVGALQDETAVLRLLRLKEGRFRFTRDLEPGEERMRATITGLLLEASRQADEGQLGPAESGNWNAERLVPGGDGK